MPPTATPSAPARSMLDVARLAAADIKLAHSVFALPFAILGAFLAAWRIGPPASWSRLAWQLALVVVCMVLARTWAMLFNRLADRRYDVENPRTARRVIASGRLSVRQGWTAALVAAGGFVLGAAGFWFFFDNPWPPILAVPVLAWIAFYSLTKRFTILCHVFLGGALAASPLAAAIAIDPATLHAPTVWFIAGMVLCWVAGFDIIYAMQDIDFDRRTGLSSIPARLGPGRGLWVARVLHVIALAILMLAWRSDARFGAVFLIGITATAALLVLEHAILIRNDTPRTGKGLDMAFFTVNGVVSCVLGLAGCIDIAAL